MKPTVSNTVARWHRETCVETWIDFISKFFFKTDQLRVARMIALEFSHDFYAPVKQKINNVPSAKLTLYRGGMLKVLVRWLCCAVLCNMFTMLW